MSFVLTWKRDRNSLEHAASKYWWQGVYWCGRDHGNPYKLGWSLFLNLQMTPLSPMYHTSADICLWSMSPVNKTITETKYWNLEQQYISRHSEMSRWLPYLEQMCGQCKHANSISRSEQRTQVIQEQREVWRVVSLLRPQWRAYGMHSNAQDVALLGACCNPKLTLLNLSLYYAHKVIICRVSEPTWMKETQYTCTLSLNCA